MLHFTKLAEKKMDDGATVLLLRDTAAHGYYVSKKPDDQLEEHPMGAFASLDAARSWADMSFPGGQWQPGDH